MANGAPLMLSDVTATIPLTRGLFATIDAADIPLLLGHAWCAVPNPKRTMFYAVTPQGIRMHRLIAGAAEGVPVNHRDGDGLNNRKSNLRERPMRLVNVVRPITAGPLPRGVKLTPAGRYEARLQTRREYRHLGVFDTADEAAAVYEAAAKQQYGAWADRTVT